MRRRGPFLVGGAVALTIAVASAWLRSPPAQDPAVLPEAPVPPRPAPGLPTAPVPLVPEAAPPPVFTDDDALELAGANGIVCALEPPLEGGVARLELAGDEAFAGLAVIAGGYLVLSEVPAEGEGTLRVEGFAPRAVRWSDALDGPVQGGCEPDVVTLEPSSTAIVGTVRHARGREVTVEVCGTPTVLDGDHFYADATPGEPCDVVVRRHFGVTQWDDARQVHPEPGRDLEVDFDVPDIDAVLPLVLEPASRGLRVAHDWTDLGLDGRIVVSAAGVAAGDDPVAFHMAAGGGQGTVAEVVLADGEVVEVERRALGFDDWLLEQ